MEASVSGEEALLQAARADPAAFEELYNLYFSRVFRYIRKRVATVEEAEDLSSEVFIRAFRSINNVRGPSFAAWVFRIAHNQIANHHRDKKHDPILLGDAEDAQRDVSADFTRVETRELVWKLAQRLTPDQREVVRLKFAGGLTTREIGAVIGKNEGAVKMLLSRAMQSMREALAMEGV